jgi:OmpA family protein
LSSDQNQPGDRFTATVETNGTGYDLPAGTRVEGVVTQVQQARSNRPGTLDVQFNDLRLPDGQTYRIAGSPTSLDSKSVQRTSDGRLVSRSSSSNHNKFIAYGAGAGLIIGSMLGSNVKGALAGAAAGYLFGRFNKNKGNGHEVVLKPGTEFGVRLDQRVALASASGNGYGYGRGLANSSGYGRTATGYGRTATGYGRTSTGYGRTSTGYGRTTTASSAYGAPEVVLPEGSVLKVRLDNGLSSDKNQTGDPFTATITSDNSGYNLPAGTRVEGVVSQVQQASSNQPGTLDVRFNDLRLPDGETYRIAGAPISLDSKSVQQTSSGQLVARPEHRNDRTKFIAYGAGAGLLIGSLLGSNVKGGLAGAAAGYLYGQFHKNKSNGHEVVLKPGTEFGVRLDQRVALAPSAPARYRTRVGG